MKEEKAVTSLFVIGVDKIPYINSVFAFQMMNEPETINALRIKARVKIIGSDGYETIDQVNSIELWLEEEE